MGLSENNRKLKCGGGPVDRRQDEVPYKPRQAIHPPFFSTALPRPATMDCVDIPFDSVWCPVCSREIVPKRIHLPAPAPARKHPPARLPLSFR